MCYLQHLRRDRHNGPSTLLVAVSALRFFYRHVLHRPTAAIETALPRMKRPKSLSRVFSPEQIARLLQVEQISLKHRTMLMTGYASGVRVSELCALRPEHLLAERGQIRVEQGQGAKDRYTHLHCIVTGGGLREDGSWAGRPPHWLFPVRALSAKFRGKYRAGLQRLYQDDQREFHGQLQPLAAPAAFAQLLRQAGSKKWNVYAKRPFAGPEVVLAYLARPTHRVGITNHRILDRDKTARTVRFAYKDYADHSRAKTLTIAGTEFVRRLQLHLLPERFGKIRHDGLLANRNRHPRIAEARAARPPAPGTAASLPAAGEPEAIPAPEAPVGLPRCCPHCHQRADWVLVERVSPQHQRPRCTVPYHDSS